MLKSLHLAFVLAALGGLALPLFAAQDPVGVWNLKLRVGHVGEGIRIVLLEVTKPNDKLSARMSSLSGKMQDVDELKFEKGILTVVMGDYTYRLKFDNEKVTGTVTSPAGPQDITGTRQSSLRLLGDTAPPLRRAWSGRVSDTHCGAKHSMDDAVACTKACAKTADDLVLITGTNLVTRFTNPQEFADALMGSAGKPVRITGLWLTDKIKIEKVVADTTRR